MPYTRLNAAALTDQDALILPLLSDAVPTFRTLVDSGSEDQFMDIQFAEQHRLPQKTLQQPLRLRLFDGSTTATAPAKTVRACAGNRASA